MSAQTVPVDYRFIGEDEARQISEQAVCSGCERSLARNLLAARESLRQWQERASRAEGGARIPVAGGGLVAQMLRTEQIVSEQGLRLVLGMDEDEPVRGVADPYTIPVCAGEWRAEPDGTAVTHIWRMWIDPSVATEEETRAPAGSAGYVHEENFDPITEGGSALAVADDIAFIEEQILNLIGDTLTRYRFMNLAIRGAKVGASGDAVVSRKSAIEAVDEIKRKYVATCDEIEEAEQKIQQLEAELSTWKETSASWLKQYETQLSRAEQAEAALKARAPDDGRLGRDEPTADISALTCEHAHYLRIVVEPKNEPLRRFRISRGLAEGLRAELDALLSSGAA